MNAYPLTYYAATARLPFQRPALPGSVRCDVCVVGGGLAGLSAALELAERNYNVHLVEEHRIGWGASGRSGGQCLVGTAVAQRQLETLVGLEDAHRIWEVSLAGVALVKQRIERYGIDCDWVDGQMDVAMKASQWRELIGWHEHLADHYGYTSPVLLGRTELGSILQSELYRGALYDPNCGHLHSLRYTLGLARAAEAAGVTIYEGTRAVGYRALSPNGSSQLRVHTPFGDIQCSQLILAGNAHLGATAPALMRKIVPIRTYMIATEPLGAQRAHELIRNNAAVADTNWVLNYFRLTPEHRLLFGGGISYSGLQVFDMRRLSRRRMLHVFPQLADVRTDFAWEGDIDITINRAPHFGRLAPNIWFLQGFSGHGMSLTGIAGKLVADAIGGTVERFDVFARIPHQDFPGGHALRRPILAMAMLWYRLLDLL